MNKLFKAIVAVVLPLWTMLLSLAQASEGDIAPEIFVELNKAESSSKGCRISLLFQNKMNEELSQLVLDLVVFDQNAGIIDFLSMQTGQMPIGKKRVRQYELSAAKCEGISALLINDVSQCSGGEGVTPATCGNALKVSSRAAIDLTL